MFKKGFSTILIIVIVLVVIAGGVLAWQYWPEEIIVQSPNIEEIIINPGLYEGQIVTIHGYFGGWGCGLNYNNDESPVSATKSDVGIYDSTGCLYITQDFDVVYKEKELDPTDRSNIGGEVIISGMISLIDGKPIIGSLQGEPLNYSNPDNEVSNNSKPELLQQEVNETASGIIKLVYSKSGKNYIDIDYVELNLNWVPGGMSEPAYQNNNSQIRTFEISPSAEFIVGSPATVPVIFAEFQKIFTTSYKSDFQKHNPWDIIVTDGVVVNITEHFIP